MGAIAFRDAVLADTESLLGEDLAPLPLETAATFGSTGGEYKGHVSHPSCLCATSS
jgi:hypothetical protein